jgi:hypothetical protein
MVPWKLKPMKRTVGVEIFLAFALGNLNNFFSCYTRQYHSCYCWSRNIISLVQNNLTNINIVIYLQSLAGNKPKKER